MTCVSNLHTQKGCLSGQILSSACLIGKHVMSVSWEMQNKQFLLLSSGLNTRAPPEVSPKDLHQVETPDVHPQAFQSVG
jgi:hypothetical protein